MADGSKSFGVLLVVAALVWHLLAVTCSAWVLTFEQDQARDFASYYYAVQVAADGGDPYDRRQLNAASRADATRKGVHPFLYAPPFLLTMAWVRPLSLGTAFHLWFWLHELCAVATGLVLWRWWRPLGDAVPVAIAVTLALMTAVPNNHAMGQANFPGLALAIAGLWQTDRGRPWVGGALLGAACMLKMSPALLVVWWLVRREWAAVGAAIAMAIGLSIATLPLAGPEVQLGFYTRILPTFSSGAYNGLAVPIELFGNHSIPNLFHQWFPSGTGVLSPWAHRLSTVTSLVLLGGLSFVFRAPDPDALSRAAQASCFSVLLLLVPVYTYEHHLVFAIPAAVITVVGVARGRLGLGWAVVIGVCLTLLWFDLQVFRSASDAVPDALAGFRNLIREAKTVALFGLLGGTATMGIRGRDGSA